MSETEPIEAELVEVPQAIVPWSDKPSTVDMLSVYGERGREVIEAREKILATLRTASIRATSPEDWLLFKDKENRITGYLQDSGCQRIRDLWGVAVRPTGPYEHIEADGEYAYRIEGEGECSITGQIVRGIEGCRYSIDDFAQRQNPGIQRDMAVRKAARANLDGNITRQLTGMKSVPGTELTKAWTGTGKSLDRCSKGKGFGSQAERHGAVTQEAPHVAAGSEPVCEICGAKGKYWPAGAAKATNKPYVAFWSCPKQKEVHPDQKWSIVDSDWQKMNPKPSEPGSNG